MKIEDLRKDYDELQVKYGAKELDSIYNGGCEKNPDICFVFMNPTGKNIASDKSWKGRKSPWLGTKNIWKLFYKVDLLSEETFNKIQEKKPKEWDYEFCNYVYEEIEKNKDIKFILIAGPSSSGKTTTTSRLASYFEALGYNPINVSLDDYFVNRDDTPKDENGKFDFECLEALDVKLFNENLGKLLAGESIKFPKYNFMTGLREYYKGEVKIVAAESDEETTAPATEEASETVSASEITSLRWKYSFGFIIPYFSGAHKAHFVTMWALLSHSAPLFPLARGQTEQHFGDAGANGGALECADASAVVGIIAVVAHDEILICAERPRRHTPAEAAVRRVEVGLRKRFAVNQYDTVRDFNRLPRQTNHALDERLRHEAEIPPVPPRIAAQHNVPAADVPVK